MRSEGERTPFPGSDLEVETDVVKGGGVCQGASRTKKENKTKIRRKEATPRIDCYCDNRRGSGLSV